MHQYSVTSEGQLLVPLKAIQSEKDAKKTSDYESSPDPAGFKHLNTLKIKIR